ncbi:MAG: hypothetical protein HYT80_00285 [Euryarchaeota archaeon]|nr:hypothetical protein [Euryarchaeota archaeon]
MRFDVRALPYWAAFGLGMSGGLALVATIFLRLQDAYLSRDLTRSVLKDSLVLILAALALFLAAGWAFANRPRPEPAPLVEGFTYG